MKILFVGDIHLTMQSPSSRKETNEQYRQVILDKLDYIEKICLNEDIKLVIILGDVYNGNSGFTNLFEVEAWSKFFEFRDNGIEVYSIIGNHDMVYGNSSEFNSSYLYKAFMAGAIKHLDELDFGSLYIKGIDFNKDFVSVERLSNRYTICVAHCFYENERFGGIGNGNLTDKKCIDLGYNAYILGHDHTPYPIVDTNTYKVIRPGSLTRGTSKTCNLYRKVNIEVFDTTDLSWTEREIPTKPGTEVFNEKVIMEKDIDLNLNKLLENFEASKGMNIYDIIDQQEENGRIQLKEKYDKVIDLIVRNCEAQGIYRRMN